ncbi:MAG: hypothetical protein ISS79_10455 [Phycisphaerae bacterium]|nr:hypothetical protein [Phycisphaerae bacterium]
MKPKKALAILAKGRPLVGVRIDGTLDFTTWGVEIKISKPITIRNCVLDSLKALFCYFHSPVVLRNTKILGDASFYAGYFFEGLHINQCEFLGELDLQCGGHNKNENRVILQSTRFDGFVNFFDCWYEGPFVVRGCSSTAVCHLIANRHCQPN